MNNTDRKLLKQASDPRSDLLMLIKDIGPARFVGRINSGIIDPKVGYEVLELYAHHKEPSWLERLLSWFK